jgi:uncharacterized membrane protein YuzA (DUF378 family)
MKTLTWIALILVVVGGINLGLMGIFQYDVITTIFGQTTVVARAVFTLVGVAAIYSIVVFPKQYLR